jgi:antitoxin HigA-1
MIPDTAIRQPYKTTEERGDCAPLHPGEILREDLLPHYDLSTADFARTLGVSRLEADDLLAEKRDITADLAKRLSSAFNLNTHYWLALQKQYDLWHAHEPATAGRATLRDMVHALHAA